MYFRKGSMEKVMTKALMCLLTLTHLLNTELLVGRERQTGRAERIFRAVSLFCLIPQLWLCVIIHLSKPTEYTPRVMYIHAVHWKDWCWGWNSSTLATSCEELTHWKRLWCWEGLGAGGEGDDPGWDGWMASPTRWMWVWVNSGSWWWTGRPGVLRFMGSQRLGHDWATERNWTETMNFR